MNQEIKYWKQRDEAAERYAYYKIDFDEGNQNCTEAGLKFLYNDWQSIVNTPEPTPLSHRKGFEDIELYYKDDPPLKFEPVNTPPSPEPAMSAKEIFDKNYEYYRNLLNLSAIPLDARGMIFKSMEQYAQQFTSEDNKPIPVDWDELRERFMSSELAGDLYNRKFPPKAIFDWFKLNIGGGK